MSNLGPLEKDWEAFKKQLPDLQKQAGKFAVFVDGNLEGTVATIQEAYQKGFAKAGTKPFLVQQVTPVLTVQHFTRMVEFGKCLTSS